jgi:hypothetical protein
VSIEYFKRNARRTCDDELSIMKKSHRILQRLTTFVTELNNEFFNEKLKDRLGDNINFEG